MIFVGIDPGLSGALALIDDGVKPIHIAVFDTPTTTVVRNKKKRGEYVIPEMATLLRMIRPDHVVMEKTGAMPGQGVTSMFSFGRGAGLWEGILAALEIPYTLVAPVTWKKVMLADVDKSDKDNSRIRAMQLFPQVSGELSRKKDDGRAEAILLADYGRRILSFDKRSNN